MTDRELLQMALDALEYPGPSWPDARQKAAEVLRAALANEFNPDWDRVEALQESLREHMAEIQRLRAALAQPEQEPCIHVNNPKGCYRVRCQLGNKCVNDDMSFRTTPPQREWQGLTKEEYEAMAEKCVTNCYFDTLKYAKAIEARLRDKNS